MQKLLTPKDLAERFGNDVNYWAKLRCSGDGPEFLKLGRIYYEEGAVEAWLEKKRRTSTADPGDTDEPVPQEPKRPTPSPRQRKKALQLRSPESYFGGGRPEPEAV